MLIYLILPLILTFTTLAAADSQETAQKTIERILANHEADSISEWEELMETAAKELSESLPSIASGNSLNAALNQLLENPGYSARQIPKERENDWKELYIVELNQSPTYILKLFKTDSFLFPTEFWGQWTASKLPLKSTSIAQVIKAGKITVGKNCYFFSLENYLEGTSFDDVNDKQAFKRLGASLKEFHTVSTTSVSPLPKSFLAAESQLIEDGLKLLNAEDKKWIEPLAKKLQQQLHSKPLPHSYVHGDPNMANFLLQKDKIAFIDFEVSGQYINASRQGLATPAFDLITLLDYLDDLHTADIINSFIEGYGGIPYDKETEIYFRLVDTLNAVKWYHGVKSNLTPPRFKQVQDTITSKLKRLRELST